MRKFLIRTVTLIVFYITALHLSMEYIPETWWFFCGWAAMLVWEAIVKIANLDYSVDLKVDADDYERMK